VVLGPGVRHLPRIRGNLNRRSKLIVKQEKEGRNKRYHRTRNRPPNSFMPQAATRSYSVYGL
jgi:hypothetical protein